MTAAPRAPAAPSAQPLLDVQNLARRYEASRSPASSSHTNSASTPNTVFEQVSCQVQAGEFVAIVGDSGVGKSTFLNCLAGLDHWQEGRVLHQGVDLSTMDEAQRALWRRAHLGFVFQAFHVLPHLDVAQNIALPLMLLGRMDARGRERVQQVLAAVGLDGLGQRLPQQLSGGQLQRVAIARALVHQPPLLLADEPTGNLDPGTAAHIMDLLLQQTRDNGAALVLVTHSIQAAQRADRVLRLTASGMQADAGAAAPAIPAR